MQRLVDLETVGAVLDNVMETAYEVAIDRKESLWEVKRDIDEKITFLRLIGVINEKEKEEMLDLSENTYREKKNLIEEKDLYDVGF